MHRQLTTSPRRRRTSVPGRSLRHRGLSADLARFPLDLTTLRAEWRLREPRV